MAEHPTEAADLPDEAAGKRIKDTGYGRRAQGYLQRGRKALAANDWQPDATANYYFEASEVYAMLELAEAMRESRS